MKEPHWIERADCIALHSQLIARFGGLEGIRDEGMLDSALARPIQRFHYEKPTLFELAAGYAGGIVRNHPLLDGNKRTGLVTAGLFIEINGFRLIAPEEQAVIFTRGLAAGEIEEAEYAAWLEASTEAK